MKNNKKNDSPLSVFLVLLILFGILNKIISVIAPALEILFTLFLIGIVAYVAYLIYNFIARKKQAQGTQIHPKNSSLYFDAKNDSIKRQLEILMESTALVNDSNNLDTVLHRYDLVCSCLDKLAPYSDSELRAAGYKLTGSLSDTKDFIQNNKISIVNQAIERNIRYELDQLKTNNGKIRKLNTLYDHMKRQETLEVENILFLNSLYKDLMDSLNSNSSISAITESAPVSKSFYIENSSSSQDLNIASEMTDLTEQEIAAPKKTSERIAKLSPIESENIPKHLNFDFIDMERYEIQPAKQLITGNVRIEINSEDQIMYYFYKLSEEIRSGKKILPKIEACERSYRILKTVVDIFSKDPCGLPPVIYCRDYGSSLYRKLGDWNEAERVIKFCINVGAYKYPNDKDSSAGKAALEYLETYKKIANIAIDFVKKNPGFLQKNIYSTLLSQIGEENIPILKDFMRETYVFHKQPYKSTNQLYYIERK